MTRRRKDPHAVAMAKKAVKARMLKTTPEQRSESARTAATARWAREKAKEKDKPEA